MALRIEVGKSREGALNSVDAGNGISMTKVIVYPVLKSVDTMSEIAHLDCHDSSLFSTELIKFLSLNTSVEAVDKLESQSLILSESMEHIIKYTIQASKAVSSVGNKGDELKKVAESLKKRV